MWKQKKRVFWPIKCLVKINGCKFKIWEKISNISVHNKFLFFHNTFKTGSIQIYEKSCIREYWSEKYLADKALKISRLITRILIECLFLFHFKPSFSTHFSLHPLLLKYIPRSLSFQVCYVFSTLLTPSYFLDFSHSYSCSGNSLPPARRQTLLHFLLAFAPLQDASYHFPLKYTSIAMYSGTFWGSFAITGFNTFRRNGFFHGEQPSPNVCSALTYGFELRLERGPRFRLMSRVRTWVQDLRSGLEFRIWVRTWVKILSSGHWSGLEFRTWDQNLSSNVRSKLEFRTWDHDFRQGHSLTQDLSSGFTQDLGSDSSQGLDSDLSQSLNRDLNEDTRPSGSSSDLT